MFKQNNLWICSFDLMKKNLSGKKNILSTGCQEVLYSYIFPYFQEMAIFPIFDQNVLYFLYFNEINKKFFLIEQFDAWIVLKLLENIILNHMRGFIRYLCWYFNIVLSLPCIATFTSMSKFTFYEQIYLN